MVRYFDINNPGYSIKCKLICEALRDNDRVVVFCHGFGGHKDNKAAEHFAEAAFAKMKKTAVLVFDWPCHGTDVRKKLTLEDCDRYLTMTLDYVKTELKAKEIDAYGTSFGGYLLLKYLHDHGENPFKKIVLRCPAVGMGEILYSRHVNDDNREQYEKGREITAGFDRKLSIDKAFLDSAIAADIRKYEFFDYADDILIIQGNKDEIVDVNEGRCFAEENVIEFIEVDGADHRFSDLNKLKLAHSRMVDFIRQ